MFIGQCPMYVVMDEYGWGSVHVKIDYIAAHTHGGDYIC